MKAIDGDELMGRVDSILSRVESPEIVSVFQTLKSYLENAPTLTLDDLRPKGRWIERYGVSEYKYECSLCHLGSDLMTDFCPNCGADTRGGGEDA